MKRRHGDRKHVLNIFKNEPRMTHVICHERLMSFVTNDSSRHKRLGSHVTNDSCHLSRTTHVTRHERLATFVYKQTHLTSLYMSVYSVYMPHREWRASHVTNDARHWSRMIHVTCHKWLASCLYKRSHLTSLDLSTLSICTCEYVFIYSVYMHLSRRTTHVIYCKRHTSPVLKRRRSHTYRQNIIYSVFINILNVLSIYTCVCDVVRMNDDTCLKTQTLTHFMIFTTQSNK